MVSIPLKSGLIVIENLPTTVALVYPSLNPLEIGSNCNKYIDAWDLQEDIQVSIPLKSGLIVIPYTPFGMDYKCNVSIPLKSGLIVIIEILGIDIEQFCLNPLEIGSNCNILS